MLILEICILVFGIIILVKGKISLTRNKVVTGAPAYVIGSLLTATLPLVLLIAVSWGFYRGYQAATQHLPPPDAMEFIWIDFVVVGGMAVVAAIIAATTAGPVRPMTDDDYPSTTVALQADTPAGNPRNPYSSPK